MSDIFQNFLEGIGPVSRELTYNGVTGTIYIRKPTAAQALQLARGQSVNVTNAGSKSKGGDQSMQLDLGDLELKRQMTVHFCICEADGSSKFKSLAQVQALPSDFIAALAAAIDEEAQFSAGK